MKAPGRGGGARKNIQNPKQNKKKKKKKFPVDGDVLAREGNILNVISSRSFFKQDLLIQITNPLKLQKVVKFLL